jgi:DNA-binding IclR family transcriptional regulator
MACVNPDGQLSEAAQLILSAMDQPVPLQQVAAATGLPMYRIRSAVRELSEGGFATEDGGEWQITGVGLAAVRKTRNAA